MQIQIVQKESLGHFTPQGLVLQIEGTVVFGHFLLSKPLGEIR